MIGLLVWAVAIAGMLVAVVQMITARRLDLGPLILASLALVVVLGLLDVSLELSGALRAVAQGTPDVRAVLLAQHVSDAIHGILALAVGVGGISGLGGIAIFLRDLLGPRPEPAAAPEPPASPTPAV